ncbi:hypothetical protein [Umezawaea tangerina]|uniref:Uncharacterized protein n=1 Tax=Umezawaea tangerina TaxID=84725 RepID=A0A2T0TLB6_9PSEU|nr:hypothetical protein [Umezawaea tangerina]PRY46437.1 hypothetical protein CLV43_101713 [Umezawaea tangerina]
MTRVDEVRYLRTEASMAFPKGRLLALRGETLHVLAPDGWDRVGRTAAGARSISRGEAEEWCAVEGWDVGLLDVVPG